MAFDWLVYFWLMLKASLFSTGGTGNLPSLHADLVTRGWATERQFSEALAVGQISPGPTGLWVISLGYLTAGWRGAGVAMVAIMVPPLLVLLIDRLHRAIGAHPAVQGFTRGLSLAVVGVFLVVLADLLHANGVDSGAVIIMISTVGLARTGRVPVLGLLGLAASAGIVLYR